MFSFRLAAVALFLALAAGPANAGQVTEISAEGVHQILAPPQMPALGAARAPITVVEYLDYNCPYCRKIAPDLVQLTRANRDVRVLFKDWPIFGGVSVYAARAAIAANWQGKYLAAHHALISVTERIASEAQVRDLLKTAGIDLGRLDADLKAHGQDIDKALARNAMEARALGLQGTPGLVIGDILVPGSLSLENMQTLVAHARAAAKQQ